MTKRKDITHNKKFVPDSLPDSWKVIKINGPLFFAAADRVFGELNEELKTLDGVILHMEAVPILDAGGLAALSRLMSAYKDSGKQILFAEWQFQPLKTLARAKVAPIDGEVRFFPSLDSAFENVLALKSEYL